ncbi:MAG: zf-HC2 domain-containing protein [Rhodothermales bacterium]|nr:zf-HC2 domain-containing protein [Rhodothermales bacterium]
MSHITSQLNDYVDGLLPADDARAVERHLAECATCRTAVDDLRTLLADLLALPPVAPPSDLWAGIKTRLETQLAPDEAPRTPAPPRAPIPLNTPVRHSDVGSTPPSRLQIRMLSQFVAALLVVTGLAWVFIRSDASGWQVVALAGLPSVDQNGLRGSGRLRVGQWLETDATSRALLDVGDIGTVEVAPDTRLQLLGAEANNHRLVLEEGQIEAFIWAPPRLFFVDTPSALAIDLGCAYTLAVDSVGTSLLHVTSGYVELSHGGRTTLVPAGAMCRARPGRGPGTAFHEAASPTLQAALERFDFEDGGSEAVADIVREAGFDDGITLWQMIPRVDPALRGRVYDRLVTHIQPPAGVTRKGVLELDPDMLESWQRHLGLHVDEPKVKKSRLVATE